MQFSPGKAQRFGGKEIYPVQETLTKATNAFLEIPFLQQLTLMATLLLLVMLTMVIMSPELRKRFLYMLFRMALFIFAILYFFNNNQLNIELPSMDAEPFMTTAAENSDLLNIPEQVFEPPELAPIWGYLLSLIIVGVFGIFFWMFWKTIRPKNKTPFQMRELAQIAKTSLDDLEDGADWEDVIVRSYVQMGNVVKEGRGIERDEEMTPHEFALRLVDAGLPPAPVERLTRLFEFVRYSPHKAGEEQMAEAVGCFNQITAAFGEKLK